MWRFSLAFSHSVSWGVRFLVLGEEAETAQRVCQGRTGGEIGREGTWGATGEVTGRGEAIEMPLRGGQDGAERPVT